MQNILIKKNASAEDTVALIEKTGFEERNSETVQRLLKKIPFEPRLTWFKNMFWLIDSLFEFQEDDPTCVKEDRICKERVKIPDRMVKDGGGDCDDFSTLWTAILLNESVNVKSQRKIIGYESKGWDHVYVIVPVQGQPYLVLDNVAGKYRGTFNVEVDSRRQKVFQLI